MTYHIQMTSNSPCPRFFFAGQTLEDDFDDLIDELLSIDTEDINDFWLVSGDGIKKKITNTIADALTNRAKEVWRDREFDKAQCLSEADNFLMDMPWLKNTDFPLDIMEYIESNCKKDNSGEEGNAVDGNAWEKDHPLKTPDGKDYLMAMAIREVLMAAIMDKMLCRVWVDDELIANFLWNDGILRPFGVELLALIRFATNGNVVVDNSESPDGRQTLNKALDDLLRVDLANKSPEEMKKFREKAAEALKLLKRIRDNELKEEAKTNPDVSKKALGAVRAEALEEHMEKGNVGVLYVAGEPVFDARNLIRADGTRVPKFTLPSLLAAYWYLTGHTMEVTLVKEHALMDVTPIAQHYARLIFPVEEETSEADEHDNHETAMYLINAAHELNEERSDSKYDAFAPLEDQFD